MESIGALSRRTGIPIKTIRYYSDIGLVPESRRTRSGYRRYNGAALIRLELVRTLRELGFDLATIRAVLDRRSDLTEVAATQVEAIDTQIRLLRLRRAVLRRLTTTANPTDREVELVHRLAHASAEERRRLMNDFLDQIFIGLDVDPGFEARFRGAMPELPEEPTDPQIDAWVELASLVSDPDFRARVRQMSESAWGEEGSRPQAPPPETTVETITLIEQRVSPAFRSGLDPASADAAAIVDELMGMAATAAERADTPNYRREALANWEIGTDRRAERYWQLIGIINGWPAFEAKVPAIEWFLAALRANLEG